MGNRDVVEIISGLMASNKLIKKVMNVDDLLALCYIMDDYVEFYIKANRLRGKFEEQQQKFDEDFKKVMSGKKLFLNSTWRFYKSYKNVLDEISKHTDLLGFIQRNFNGNDILFPNDIDYYYNYLKLNRDKLTDIINLVKRIKELGFDEINFNTTLDFCNEEWDVSKDKKDALVFMDNIEIVSCVNDDCIKYRTNGSNYRIFVYGEGRKVIEVNNLLFSLDKLPSSLDSECLLKEIDKLLGSKKIIIKKKMELFMNQF